MELNPEQASTNKAEGGVDGAASHEQRADDGAHHYADTATPQGEVPMQQVADAQGEAQQPGVTPPETETGAADAQGEQRQGEAGQGQQDEQQQQQQLSQEAGTAAPQEGAQAPPTPTEVAAAATAIKSVGLDGPVQQNKAAKHEGSAGPSGGGAGAQGSASANGTASDTHSSSVGQLLSLLQQHPDHETAIAAAMQAVQSTLRGPSGRQHQGKRPATGPAGVDYEEEEQQQPAVRAAGGAGRGAGGRKARGKKGAAQQQQQQAGAEGPTPTGAAAGAAGEGSSQAQGEQAGAVGEAAAGQQQQQQQQQGQQEQQEQQGQPEQKAGGAGLAAAALASQTQDVTKDMGKRSRGPAAVRAARQAKADAGQQQGQQQQPGGAAGIPGLGPPSDKEGGAAPQQQQQQQAAAAAADKEKGLPDMATYLDAYPMCKKVLNGIRATPNNQTKTPVSLLNEYANRMMREVVFQEHADAPTGPYTVRCLLQDKSGKQFEEDAGTGRGRNKRDARQVSAAACVEALLRHTPEVDFFAPTKTSAPTKNPNVKPGLGYSGRGQHGPSGLKKRRDGDASWSGSFMGVAPPGGPRGGFGPPGAGWQAPHPRPVPFTRATMPSSLPSAFNRMGPEVVPPPRPHPPPLSPPPPYGPMRAFPPAAAPAPAYAPSAAGPGGLPPPAMQAPGAFGMHTLQAGLPGSQKRDFMTAMSGPPPPYAGAPPPGPLDLSGLQGSLADASGLSPHPPLSHPMSHARTHPSSAVVGGPVSGHPSTLSRQPPPHASTPPHLALAGGDGYLLQGSAGRPGAPGPAPPMQPTAPPLPSHHQNPPYTPLPTPATPHHLTWALPRPVHLPPMHHPASHMCLHPHLRRLCTVYHRRRTHCRPRTHSRRLRTCQCRDSSWAPTTHQQVALPQADGVLGQALHSPRWAASRSSTTRPPSRSMHVLFSEPAVEGS